MKRIIISSVLLLAGLVTWADEVSYEKAFSVAQEFMGKTDLTLQWDGKTDASEAVAFYVFSSQAGGWVIVSADDSTVPILAYSDTGSFGYEGMPSNISDWFGRMRKDIHQFRKDGLKGSAEIQRKWKYPRRIATRASSSKELTTPKWNQQSPYNYYLSQYVKSGKQGVSNLYTGCVATAMAEVLYYHKWPETGTGTIGGYTTDTKGYTVSTIDISQHTYDWDNMLSSYSNSASTAQKEAVGLLMLDCGVMVEMDYTNTSSGSGASPLAVVPALARHMQYAKTAELKLRSDYTDSEWLSMIAEEIDNDRPLLYGGYTTSSSGHQFVCDGYDLDNEKLHINWGWGGTSNGYYSLTLNSGNGTYSQNQMAVFGIEPDRDGSTAYPDIDLEMVYYDYEDSVNGTILDEGIVAKGETFYLSAGKFSNPSYNYYYSGALQAVLVDKDGHLKEAISNVLEMTDEDDADGLPPGYVCWFENGDEDERFVCKITKDIALGDRIAFWYRLNDGTTWKPVSFDGTDYSYTWELACVDVTFIKTEASYAAGDDYVFALVPGNSGISSIVWTFDGSATEESSVTLSSGTHTVSATVTYSDGSSETISQVIIAK